MGLDASVMCNCYREGRTLAPPVPADLIYLDNQGFLALNLPYDGNEDAYLKFDRWSFGKVCEHQEGMNYASVRVGNWGAYRLFQRGLELVGLGQFPVLRAELPNANGGLMYPESVAKALDELAYFRRQKAIGTNTFLVDTVTGEIVMEAPAYHSTFIWDGRNHIEIALEPHGIVVLAGPEPYREIFRSARLEQRLHDPQLTEAYEGGTVEYVDIPSGNRVICKSAVPGKQIPWPDGRDHNDRRQIRHEYPRYMHVEQRTIDASHFSPVVEALEEVFEAASITGNPVRWT